MQKRQIQRNEFALIEKRYHKCFLSLIITCSLQISVIWLISDMLELSKVFNESETFDTLQVSKIVSTFVYRKLFEDKNRSDLCDDHKLYLHFASFSDLSMRHKISLELRVKKKLHSYPEKSFFDS